MKMIIATVKPHRFDEVMQALSKDDVLGLTTWEVQGFGRERKDRTEIYRGTAYTTKLKPMQLLMVAVTDDLVERTKATIIKHANTGEISSGKIFVVSMEDAVRIRTGESGDAGLL